jgi:hypothetical protein
LAATLEHDVTHGNGEKAATSYRQFYVPALHAMLEMSIPSHTFPTASNNFCRKTNVPRLFHVQHRLHQATSLNNAANGFFGTLQRFFAFFQVTPAAGKVNTFQKGKYLLIL